MPLARVRVLAVVMAGGTGGRMGVLADGRAKPALPFAGTHRLVDFPLSNCVNSGISDVWVVQQYEPHSLEDHLSNGRPWDLDRTRGGLLLLPPFQGEESKGGWHEGNADALWRHRSLLREANPDVVLVLSADAPYLLDYADVVEAHLAAKADVTMVTTALGDTDDPSRFGVVITDDHGRVTGFSYKPDEPATDVVTIEVFAYRPESLLDTLADLDREGEELADFGDSLLPRLVAEGKAVDHRFDGYWRDVGIPDAYLRAHRDLLGDQPRLDLDRPDWPVRTMPTARPPAHIADGATVEDSLVSPGCRVQGKVVGSVLGPGVHVGPGAEVRDSVLLHDVVVEPDAVVTTAIADVQVVVGRGAAVGATDSRGDDPALVVIGAKAVVAPGERVSPGTEVPRPS
jgi:glucose-1-phosphate adenylyltransferase